VEDHVGIDVDAVLDTRPAWVDRRRAAVRSQLERAPRLRRAALTVVVVARLALELTLPRRQVVPLTRLMVVMVVFDSVATWVWVHTGVAVEGNPLVADVMSLLGDGVGLTVRALWSAGLVTLLGWLALRRPSVRPAMVLVFVPLAAVTLVHVLALVLLWDRVLLG
jgi:hypothetical protein